MVYSRIPFVLCLTLCHYVLVFFSPFSIAITSLGEETASLSAFHMLIRFVLVWICQFLLPLGVWEGLRFVEFSLTFFLCWCYCLKVFQEIRMVLHEEQELHQAGHF